MKKRIRRLCAIGTAAVMLTAAVSGCGRTPKDNRTTIEILCNKMEAVDTFRKLVSKFEAENPDLRVVLSTPNDAITILKTRLVKNDAPDIVAIGGDRAFADFVDADIMADLSGEPVLEEVLPVYNEMAKELEIIPKPGVYCVPYAANANGVLYNRTMFRENGWGIPKTWDAFIALLDQIKASGATPIFFSLKDAWTGITPWNSIAANLTQPSLFTQVNKGEATFAQAYSETADKLMALTKYGQNDMFGYSYNDGCTAFANGKSAMYLQGNWALPQIFSASPNFDVSTFVLPSTNDPAQNKLNSGIDVLFSILEDSPHREECMRLIEFMLRHDNVVQYTDEQSAVPCVKGEFKLAAPIAELEPYFTAQMVEDFPDHHYPAEMPAGDLVQTFLITGKKEEMLQRFDKEWIKTNRDTIARLERAGHAS